MIATFVTSLVFTMVAAMTIQSAEIMFTTQNKLGINADIRNLTQDLFSEARESNTFYLYSSIDSEDRDGITDRLNDGQSGDMLALFKLEPYPTSSDPEHVSEIIIYHRDAEEEQNGPVYRTEYTFSTPSDPSASTAEQMIATAVKGGEAIEMVDLAKGLANDYLFFNSRDQSVIVNGQIIHGNAAKEVTDTYNFAISPRG
ncbi:MAG: hypothetical protein ACPGN3_16880 [Opitutales bacterium]